MFPEHCTEECYRVIPVQDESYTELTDWMQRASWRRDDAIPIHVAPWKTKLKNQEMSLDSYAYK